MRTRRSVKVDLLLAVVAAECVRAATVAIKIAMVPRAPDVSRRGGSLRARWGYERDVLGRGGRSRTTAQQPRATRGSKSGWLVLEPSATIARIGPLRERRTPERSIGPGARPPRVRVDDRTAQCDT